MMEPKSDECFGICTNFKENPILRQGDARKYDLKIEAIKPEVVCNCFSPHIHFGCLYLFSDALLLAL